MLNKPLPLRDKQDFTLVFKKGRHVGSGFFRIAMRPNKLGVLRLGVVTGQKFSKSAVVRNRARRRIREAIRQHVPEIHKGLDMIIVPNPSAATAACGALVQELLADLRRAHVFS